MTAEERERITESIEEFAADVGELAYDFNAHLTPENDWPQDQHQALADKVERFHWYLRSLAPTRQMIAEAYADDAVREMRACR